MYIVELKKNNNNNNVNLALPNERILTHTVTCGHASPQYHNTLTTLYYVQYIENTICNNVVDLCIVHKCSRVHTLNLWIVCVRREREKKGTEQQQCT